VPRSSAVIPGLPRAKAIGLDADHVSMVKFYGRQDENFKRVMYQLNDLVQFAVESHSTLPPPLENTSTQPPENPCPSYKLPLRLPFPRNERFIGRADEMATLEAILHPSGDVSSRRTAVLYGTTGTGKSELALEYAYRHYSEYSAILWVNVRTDAALMAEFILLASLISPKWDESLPISHNNASSVAIEAEQYFSTAARAKELVKNWMAENDNDKWLLVLDNLDELSESNWRDLLPSSPHGKIIVTTRDSDHKRLAGGAIEIDRMDPLTAREFLCLSAGVGSCSSDKDVEGMRGF
jgi:hypothetical protein